MSNFIKGDVVILSVKTASGSDYVPIACLTSNSLAETRNIIESQTKCNPGVVIKDSGSYTYELSFDGRYIDDSDGSGSASHHILATEFLRTGTPVEWKMETGISSPTTYFGTGIIASLSMDASAGDEMVNFSGSISGSGDISEVAPS